MTEPIEEFDHSKYSGQVHVWKYPDGTINGEPRIKVWICRRYTDPKDTEWGCWIQVDGDDKDGVAIKLLHFCSHLRYEILPAPDDMLIGDALSLKLYNKYKEEAEQADTFVDELGEEVNQELSSLFASFSAIQQLGLEH